MKKVTICVLLILVLVATVACTQTAVPTRSVRWEAGEKLIYDVSYIPNKAEDGKLYPQLEVEGAVVIPVNIEGTYICEVLDVTEKVTTLKTTLEVWNSYPKKKVGDISSLNIADERIISDENTISVLNTTVTTVVFPLNSCVSVKIEAKTFALIVDGENQYTPYYEEYTSVCKNFSDKAISTVTLSDGTVLNKSVNVSNAGEFTDNSALLYIVRSLDMGTLAKSKSTTLNATDTVNGTLFPVTVSNTENPAYTTFINNVDLDNEKIMKVRVYTSTSVWGGYNYLYIDTNDDIMEYPDNMIDGSMSDICKNRILYMVQAYMLFSLRTA